jgi:hypothetical protein
LVLVGDVAHAACPVELVLPKDTESSTSASAWTSAADDLRRRLAENTSDECGSVEIDVSAKGGALLTFTTRDGRRAVRALESADEARPSLEALLVTRAEPSSNRAAESPKTEPPPTVAPAPRDPQTIGSRLPLEDLARPARPADTLRWIVGLGAGARFGFPGAFASPAFTLRPSVAVGKWELGAAAEWDPTYAYLPGSTPSGFYSWSFQAGFTMGRRQPLGAIDLAFGLGLSIASVREGADKSEDGTARTLDTAQPRASAYVHLVFARTSRIRPTLDLGTDVALGQLARQGSDKRDLPELPRWGLVLTAGAEGSILP